MYQPSAPYARFRGQLRNVLKTDLPLELAELLVPGPDREAMALCHRTQYNNVTMHIVKVPTQVCLEVWPTAFAGKYPVIEKIEGRDHTVWGRVYYRPDLKVWISLVCDLPGIASASIDDEHHRTFHGALCRCRLMVNRYAPEAPANWQRLFMTRIRPLKRLFPSWEEVKDEKGALVHLEEVLHRPKPVVEKNWREAYAADYYRSLENEWARDEDRAYDLMFPNG